ncbi:MAG: hypothetical protein P4L53_00930 [Candidatus Obscuribacterales bacterium]|nr:hypothetical protein [Candidatus Obscuribacterales bacterium]
MGAEKFDLKPAQQCTVETKGHLGEAYKEVFQGQAGIVAREVTWTPQQLESLEHRQGFAKDGAGDSGPTNKTYLDMAFKGEVYSLGEFQKNLTINDKPVLAGSPLYKDALAKMEEAKKSINFDAPMCNGDLPALFINLDKKDQ